jgi:drug/metabolite transporter (DMT)-like permease
MEVVFSALFALIFTDETLSIQKIIGGVLIVAAMLAIVMKSEPVPDRESVDKKL